jgi:3D (Asp-Asp-Asp) domain-containing protein
MVKKIIAFIIVAATVVYLYQLNSNISKLQNDLHAQKFENFELKNKNNACTYDNYKLKLELAQINNELLRLKDEIESKTFIAKVTAYSPLDDVNGINSSGNPNVTATGMTVSRGVVAVDPRKIPYGTKLKIEGFDRMFIAGDTGGALRNYDGYAIDIFKQTYDEALKFGVKYLEVTIIDE